MPTLGSKRELGSERLIALIQGGIPENMVCGIFMFRWSAGRLCKLPTKEREGADVLARGDLQKQ